MVSVLPFPLYPFAFSLSCVLGQHVAEERALFDGVFEGFVRVRQVVEPVLRHV